jgi:hypothetical protein
LTLGSYAANAWPANLSINSSIESTWMLTFTRTPQREALRQKVRFPYVTVEVRVRDGRVYRGLLAQYSKDIEVADREIVLEPPIYVSSGESDEMRALHSEGWHRLILPASEIVAILVNYSPRSNVSDGKRAASGPISAERNVGSRMVDGIAKAVNWCFERRNEPKWLAALLCVEIILIGACAVTLRIT